MQVASRGAENGGLHKAPPGSQTPAAGKSGATMASAAANPKTPAHGKNKRISAELTGRPEKSLQVANLIKKEKKLKNRPANLAKINDYFIPKGKTADTSIKDLKKATVARKPSSNSKSQVAQAASDCQDSL